MKVRAFTSCCLYFACAVVLSGSRSVRMPLPDRAHNFDSSQYDDVIEIETEELKDYLTFPHTKLVPVVRASVNYLCDTKHNRFSPVVRYEEFWYLEGEALGCRRLREFGIKPRDTVAIVVKHKGSGNQTSSEMAASANAIVRLYLDATINHNLLRTVLVPAESMASIKEGFEKYDLNFSNIVSY